MVLTINNEAHRGISNREDLLETLQTNNPSNAEIWLELNSDFDGELPHLCLLKNEQVCCLQYMTTRSAARRFYSYDSDPAGDVKKVYFQLANGEYYESYSNNCIGVEDGYAVLIDFLETNGGKSTWITWQKD